MSIRCPHCQHEIQLQGARAGRFSPRCPQCKEKFALQVPEDVNAKPIVKKIEAAPVRASAMATAAPNAKPQAAKVETPAPVPSPTLQGRVGGYEVLQRLGQGGMGEVYLARQISLDRNVALKVLAPSLAGDPQFVARFTREAYAAAQLTHHNIVQIHDIGAERDTHYFSMEFVQGHTLSNVVHEAGKLDAETAAGYVLQAARGLKFAHERGMIHRDVKPENLLLNAQGIVKVADLGLVKHADGHETNLSGAANANAGANDTQLNVSMGTPAYMPPEQAADAAHVDQRADIYSLGCTLYDLLTGRPPFTGKTAVEVITKHQREQITPPEMVVKNVPLSLSQILLKMVAKKPDQRYQTMNEVILALEDFLGVASTGPFTPKEEHVKILEFAAERFNGSKWRVLRSQLILGFFAVCGLATAVLGWSGHPLWAAAMIGFAVLTFAAYQVTIGITQKSHLFIKFRQLIFGSSIGDWLSWIVICALVIFLLYVSGWLWPWIGVGVIAIAAAAAFHFTIDLLLQKDRSTPMTQTEAMLKQMRLRGLDELAVRQFVCKYSGNKWEEFYEALFGYEAKLQARQLWGKSDRGRDRKKYAAWRDSVIRWIENKQAARQEAKQRKTLQKVEATALKAKGFSAPLADKQAKKNAQRLMSTLAKAQNQTARRAAATMAPTAAPTKIETVAKAIAQESQVDGKKSQQDEEDDFEREHLSWFQRRFGSPVDFVLGQQMRFILAVIILAAFALWWQQNKGREALEETAAIVQNHREIDIASAKKGQISEQVSDAGKDLIRGAEHAVESTSGKTLEVPLVPLAIRQRLSGWNAGLAGAILLISIFFMGRLLSIAMLFAAGIALFGTALTLPAIGQPPIWMVALAAAMAALFALVFLRPVE
jgi:serine/threonine protein kinase